MYETNKPEFSLKWGRVDDDEKTFKGESIHPI